MDYERESSGTNASGAIRKSASPLCAWIIGGALSVPGTSAAISTGLYIWDEGTRTGLAAVSSEETTFENSCYYVEGTSQAIMELRRLSGLTWDQIARIFGVNRRSVHFWANGKAMNQLHEEKLHTVLAVVRKIDTGSASANRSALLSCDSQGRSPVDMLRDANFTDIFSVIGVSKTSRVATRNIANSEFERRKIPATPQQLLGTLHENVHVDAAPKKRVLTSKIRKK